MFGQVSGPKIFLGLDQPQRPYPFDLQGSVDTLDYDSLEPAELPSSNSILPIAWITEPATVPSLYLTELQP